jgi:hypothetical protein
MADTQPAGGGQAGQNNQADLAPPAITLDMVQKLIDSSTQALKADLEKQTAAIEKVTEELAAEKDKNSGLIQAMTMQQEQILVLTAKANSVGSLIDAGLLAGNDVGKDAHERVVQLMELSAPLLARIESLPSGTLPETCNILELARHLHNMIRVFGAGLEIFTLVHKAQGSFAYGKYCRKAGEKVFEVDYLEKGKRSYGALDNKIADPIVKEAEKKQDDWEKRQGKRGKPYNSGNSSEPKQGYTNNSYSRR